MNKKIIRTIMLMSLVFVLTACGKKPEAKVAVEAFVNTEFYLKDFEEYEKAFGEKVDKDSAKVVKKDLSKELDGFGITPEDSEEVADEMLKAIIDKTSFTTKTLSETKEKATVELTIKGIDMNQFQVDIVRNLEEKLLALISEAGVEDLKTYDDLMNLTSEADVETAKKIADDFSKDSTGITEVVKKAITEMKTIDTESKVKVELIQNEKHKKFWEIKNESALIDELTAAFMI